MRAVAVTAIVFALGTAHATFAQQPPQAPAPPAEQLPPQAPRPAAAPRAPQAPRPAPAPGSAAPAPAPAPAPPAPFVMVDPNQPGQLVNIQIDVRIVEESPGEASVTKTVTLTVADRQSGSSRAVDRLPEGVGILNVDVGAVVQSNGRILTRIGLEYQNMNEQPSVQMRAQPLLESGKVLRVSRSASAKGNRTITVDVTATVLK